MRSTTPPTGSSQASRAGPEYSEELSEKIDQAIKNISDDCYLNALNILMTNRACLDRIADELKETG